MDILHADHSLLAAHIDFVERFALTQDGFFVENVKLPKDVCGVTCDLHGPTCGDAPIKESEVCYRVRGTRAGPSRLVDRPSRYARHIVIVGKTEELWAGNRHVIIYTAYGNLSKDVAPREPWSKSLRSERAKRKSERFWSEHALTLHR